MFVSQASINLGIIETYGIKKRVEAVKNCRNIGKKDMKYNDAMPKMKVDPESYVSCAFAKVESHRIKFVTLANLPALRTSAFSPSIYAAMSCFISGALKLTFYAILLVDRRSGWNDV